MPPVRATTSDDRLTPQLERAGAGRGRVLQERSRRRRVALDAIDEAATGSASLTRSNCSPRWLPTWTATRKQLASMGLARPCGATSATYGLASTGGGTKG